MSDLASFLRGYQCQIRHLAQGVNGEWWMVDGGW